MSLLGGRVPYVQPTHGHRSGIEPVLLAASIPARAGHMVLEGGAGAGAATVIEVAIVDHTGTIGTGCLAAGDNPVLMTFEGVLEAVA